MSKTKESIETEPYSPDAEWQLAFNLYNNIRKTIGRGTLSKFQRLIEDLPLTRKIERDDIDVNPLDDDD